MDWEKTSRETPKICTWCALHWGFYGIYNHRINKFLKNVCFSTKEEIPDNDLDWLYWQLWDPCPIPAWCHVYRLPIRYSVSSPKPANLVIWGDADEKVVTRYIRVAELGSRGTKSERKWAGKTLVCVARWRSEIYVIGLVIWSNYTRKQETKVT